MASNPGPNPLTPPGFARKTIPRLSTPEPPFNYTPISPKDAAMHRLRALQDPETEAINQHYRRTGQLPRVLGSSPLATSSGIAGTRFTPVNRPVAGTSGTRPGGEDVPGVTINRAINGGVAPGANPQGRNPGPARGTRGRLPAPKPMGLPPGVILRQPGLEPRRNMTRYGAFIEDSPEPPPARRPDVPPPTDAEMRARLAMQTGQRGVMKYPIRYMGILPDVLSEDFDASTGYNPPPPGQRGTEAEERAWKKVREESLRGVRFEEWNTSWLMRMAQLKGVSVALEGGDAAVREALERELTEVKIAERAVAVQVAAERRDGGRWARVVEREVEQECYILLDEDKDDLEKIKSKVAMTWQRTKMDIAAGDVSLWLSAVTWGNKPSRMVRWAGRNAEMDDGHWLGFYMYRMTRTGKRAEVEGNERYEREMRKR
ncbi:hypothetical protein VC83_02125 [Pseudogymnoascus destructans]|uniref:Uncharacterized protein n=2 Tax=Pseudogymnoascus destructans TaxID=655981 RepID=L8G3U4_PSED2|nr:uncharacterized protein VC83_02125 [Pseudogymnoascus destructans]ELR07494.1 hypothetical protein GMDG_02586 [Pseudogymnoascus destructans 20631-21]OAF61250.1 hypothetical protein VC83_02125 [Pseudogymnoascus destructans]